MCLTSDDQTLMCEIVIKTLQVFFSETPTRSGAPHWSSLPCWPWHLWPRWHGQVGIGWFCFQGFSWGAGCLSWMFTYDTLEQKVPLQYRSYRMIFGQTSFGKNMFLSTKVAVLTSQEGAFSSGKGDTLTGQNEDEGQPGINKHPVDFNIPSGYD